MDFELSNAEHSYGPLAVSYSDDDVDDNQQQPHQIQNESCFSIPLGVPIRRSIANSDKSKEVENTSEFQSSRNRRYALFLYGLTTVMLYADQNLLSPNLTAIANEFNFTSVEKDYYLGGQIALGFWLVGAPASYIIGILGDRYNRASLFALTVFMGEGSCLATYFTHTFRGLYITRVLTGISIGGAMPLIYSLLGDFYPPEDRSAVNAVVGMGTGLGISLGQGISGYVGPIYGWRFPFVIVSIPALICAALVRLTVVDPVRGSMDLTTNHLQPSIPATVTNDSGTTVSLQEKLNQTETFSIQQSTSAHTPNSFRALISWLCHHLQPTFELLRIQTVLLVLIQGAFGCIPWGIVNTYLNDYLSEDKGLSVQGATTLILTFGIGVFFGMVVAAVMGNCLYKRDPRYPQLASGTMAIVGVFPMYFLLNGVNSSTSIPLTGAIAILAGLGSGVTGPIVKATLTNVTLPTSRGAAFALLNSFDDVGRGLGPMVIALLIMAFDGNRQLAFNVGILGWVLCGVGNLMIFYVVKQDEISMRSKLMEISIYQI